MSNHPDNLIDLYVSELPYEEKIIKIKITWNKLLEEIRDELYD